jgi:predicted RNA-binding protein with TRAM domain
MEIPPQLRCLFSGTIEERADSYVIEVPADEIQLNNVRLDKSYRVGILPETTQSNGGDNETQSRHERDHAAPTPPVEEGETRTVEIEDIGDQGDGVTRVERGFVVIVPETEQGERVVVEVTDVRENVAFATVVDRVSYYD